jgi:alpha-amylase
LTALIFYHMSKRLFALLSVIFILTACVPAAPTPAPVSTVSPTPESTSETTQLPWWRDAIFYEIFVRSFYDTDGNGIGDLNGITQKLGYLQKIGINAIWLMPIHPSPSYHGYDVTNYYAVNSEYGTMDDFKNLLIESHKHGIRIVIDLVLNHTSSLHPFFVDANSSPDSKYRNWYIWSDTAAGNDWHPGNNGYYFGHFCDCMPDLNYRNPEVTTQMENVVRFWLKDVGVDGFRIDAAKHLIEEGDKIENTQSTHAWFKGFYTFYKSIDPNAYTIGEVYGAGASVVKSYTGDQLDQIFNFEMSSGFINSVNGGSTSGINSAIKFAWQDMPDFNFGTFLTNHDQNRTMSVLNGDLGKAKAAATLLLTSPGTPFIYYGEEIGLQGKKPDEDIRLPMQWSGDANAGFTTGTPWRAPATGYEQVNVALENEDSSSLLNHYRLLNKLRQGHQALANGNLHLVETGNSGVYAVLRSSGSEKILVLVNLKDTPISDYQLSLNESVLSEGVLTPKTLFGTTNATQVTISEGRLNGYKPIEELLPDESYVFQLE